MTREMYEQKIKDLQEKFPDIRGHHYDEYRCKYFRGVIDIQFDYIKELERRIEEISNITKKDN